MEVLTEWVTVTCGAPGCAMTFLVPKAWYQDRQRTKATWHCPNGHERVFTGKTDADRLREEKAALEKRLAAEQATTERVRESRRRVELRLRAAKGQVTKLRRAGTAA